MAAAVPRPLRPRSRTWHARRVNVARRVIELLIDDAPREVVESEMLACRRAIEVMSEVERGESRADLDLAVDLGALLDKHRRRSRELRALYETASDLSSMRDVSGVLRAIVKRGRQLLDTDVAYLMLVDEQRGDTFMRVTEGTTSAEFRDIRLPLGVGLGGRVAQVLAPHWTRNYLTDERFTHVIDGIVLEEQLVAILGVPLAVGNRLLGVLFAADRDERDFSQGEVSLLASLAHHAAIAIDNAQLLQETREALNALASANSVIEEINRGLERTVEVHEHLMAAVTGGGSLQELADVIVDVMGGCVVFVDSAGRETVRAMAQEGCWREAVDVALAGPAQLQDLRRTTLVRIGEQPVLVTPVITGDERLGSVLYTSDAARESDGRNLERAASVIALLLLNRRAQDEADNRVRGELLAELLMGKVGDEDSLRRRARLLDIDLSEGMAVLVVLPTTAAGSKAVQAHVGGLVRNGRGLMTVYSDRIVLTLPLDHPCATAPSLAARLQGLGATVGGSAPAHEVADMSVHAERAHRAAKVLVALGRRGEGCSVEDLGLYGLLLSDSEQQHIRAFVDATIGQVQRYDSRRGSSLVPTLEAYFAAECHAVAAAESLFVHVNTVYQRLERVDRLLGDGWRLADRALEIRLALRLARMLS